MYSDIISSALERFHHYLERNLPFCRDHRAARVSAFWTEHFSDRRNFPKVPDFLTFRQGDYLYGIGDTKHASTEQKQGEFDDIRKSIGFFMLDEFFERAGWIVSKKPAEKTHASGQPSTCVFFLSAVL